MPKINREDLNSLYIIVPPLFEQKKIASILSTWDQIIEQTRKVIDAKRCRKKALMQQLLSGKKRLYGSTASWSEYRLGDLFTKRDETNNTHLPLLAITASRGVIPANEIDRKDASAQDKSNYKRIAPGDIGYNTMRMWQGVSAVSNLEGIVSPAYTVCVPNMEVDVRFMGYLFKFPPVVHSFFRHSQGLVSDTWNLKFPHFAQIKVRIPGLDEQRRIAEVLSTVDYEIQGLEKGLTALERQKRGLMQKLLTGEVRVKI
jgi:type I restriction enzyme S subunit